MWMKVLFSFKGRIGRQTYAAGLLANILVLIAMSAAVYFIITPIIRSVNIDAQLALCLKVASIVLAVIVPSWIYLALTLKRLHDIDKDSNVLTVLALPFIGPMLLSLVLIRAQRHSFNNRHGIIPKKFGEVGSKHPRRLITNTKLLPKPL